MLAGPYEGHQREWTNIMHRLAVMTMEPMNPVLRREALQLYARLRFLYRQLVTYHLATITANGAIDPIRDDIDSARHWIDNYWPEGGFHGSLSGLDGFIPTISPQQAIDAKMFGPVWHGTTEAGRVAIEREGFKFEAGGLPTSGMTAHGYVGTGAYAAGRAPPIHHLGYGVYLTTNKAIAKRFNGMSARGIKTYYVKVSPDRLETINWGSPNTMMKWWVANGFDLASGDYSDVSRAIATTHMTNQLRKRWDAIWYKGKGMYRLLDGDQIVVFDPERIYEVDVGLARGLEIGAKVIRRSDGMKGQIVRRREVGQEYRQYHGGATVWLDVKWAKGGLKYNETELTIVPTT